MKDPKFTYGINASLILLVLVLGVVATWTSGARPQASQLSARDRDLSQTFSNFSIAKLSGAEASRQVSENQRLLLSLPDRNLELTLVPHDLRSANYRASETGPLGERPVGAGPVNTFKGTVVGHPGTFVRFTIDHEKIEGLILDGDQEFFVELARKYSPAADADDLVFYERTDLRAPANMECDVTGVEKVDRAARKVDTQTTRTSAMTIVELATEADFDYVNSFGGSATSANAQILSLMNQVEAIYERDLNLSFRITFQHGWTGPDPFNGADQVAFLTSYQAYWNANFTTVQRDTTHMWTGRAQFLGVGRAYRGVICRSPTAAYGYSGKVGQFPQEYILPAHELGHVINCSHPDQDIPAQPQCADSVMVSSISFTNSGAMCTYSINQAVAYMAANPSCLSTQVNSKNRFDFDGDKKTDLTVFRPSEGAWYRLNSSNGQFVATQFGQPGDRPVPEDYDGDGKADTALFRPSNGGWYIIKSASGALASYGFGINSDLPVPGDYDGDNKADVAVYRPADGAWYILNSSNGTFRAVFFGVREDVPAPGDFDGDGKSDFAVFRGSTGAWYIMYSSDGSFHGLQFGANGDRPVPADFDGDGKSDVALYRSGTGGWYLLGSANGALISYAFGTPGDRPVPSDFDGDGKADIAVYRPSNGFWFELRSASGNAFAAQNFGSANDLPAPAAYVP